MSCEPIYARAGDAFPLLLAYELEGVAVPLTGLNAKADFRSKSGALLLTLTEGAGLTTAGPDGSHTIKLLANATQTLALAPPGDSLRHDLNLAVRVFDPLDIPNTSETIADLTVIVRAQEVSAP